MPDDHDQDLCQTIRRRTVGLCWLNLIFGPAMITVLMFGSGAVQMGAYIILMATGPLCLLVMHRVDLAILRRARRSWWRALGIGAAEQDVNPASLSPAAQVRPVSAD